MTQDQDSFHTWPGSPSLMIEEKQVSVEAQSYPTSMFSLQVTVLRSQKCQCKNFQIIKIKSINQHICVDKEFTMLFLECGV